MLKFHREMEIAIPGLQQDHGQTANKGVSPRALAIKNNTKQAIYKP